MGPFAVRRGKAARGTARLRRCLTAAPRALRAGPAPAAAARALTSWGGRVEHGGGRLEVPLRRNRSTPLSAAVSRRRLLLPGGQPRRAAEPGASAGRLQLEPGVAGPVDVGVVSNGRFPARLRGTVLGTGMGGRG